MKILSITLKDLQLFFKDRGSLMWLFVVPMVFIITFTGLFTLSQGGTTPAPDKRPGMDVVNLDEGGKLAEAFIDSFNTNGGYDIRVLSLAEAEKEIRMKTIFRYLVIPAGFSQALEASLPVTLQLFAIDAQSATTQSVLLAITGVARDMALQTQLVASLRQMGEMTAGLPEQFQVFTSEVLVQQAESQFRASAERPLVAIREELPAMPEKKKLDINPIQLSVPGFTILFVFLAAQTTARSFYDEKKTGSFRRLMAAPLGNPSILVGKLLPNYVITLIQIVVIFLVSSLLLPLLGMGRLSFGADPLALVLAALVTSLCSTSLGIVIASLARTEAQIGGISSLILWVTGFIGGTIIPAEIFDVPLLTNLGKFVPQSHAVNAFKDILVRGYTLEHILPSLGFLLLFSLVFFAFGAWRFDYE